jgi:hypothetical protein
MGRSLNKSFPCIVAGHQEMHFVSLMLPMFFVGVVSHNFMNLFDKFMDLRVFGFVFILFYISGA